MSTKIEAVTISEAVRAGGNVLAAGTYRVEMPADYDPAEVTGEDILLDGALSIAADQTDTIRTLLDSCIAAARAQGYTGDDYEHTAADLEWVTDELGYLPTREQWEAAGLPHVGGAHVGESR